MALYKEVANIVYTKEENNETESETVWRGNKNNKRNSQINRSFNLMTLEEFYYKGEKPWVKQ
jgi:hypothetical protein